MMSMILLSCSSSFTFLLSPPPPPSPLSPGKIMGMSVSADGQLLCSIADDKSLKIFDVVNFGEYSY